MKEMVVLFENNGCSETDSYQYGTLWAFTTRVHTGSSLSNGNALNLCTRRAVSGTERITDYGVFPWFLSAPPDDAKTLF
jgi:hypothetical protein